MPKISTKGLQMPASPIRKLTPFAEKAKSEGKTVYHLNIGQPDIETPVGMLDAVKNIDFKVWAYTQSEGTPQYRNKLAEYYQKNGYNITPSDILVTDGGSEALTIAISACIDHGEEVIIPEPFYANYNAFTCLSDAIIKPIQSSIETGFALPPISEFERLITPKTKAILICSPNNPTGYLYSKEELEELKKLVLKYDLFLICDEAYREFCYDGREFISPGHLDGLENHFIMIDTVSKRYSACGARLGALVTHNKEVYAAALKYAQARLAPPAVAQIAATAAIATPSSYFDTVIKEYSERRNLLVNTLNKMEGVYCPNPGGAFYAIVRLPIDDSDRFCEWMLDKFTYENQTVMLAPATGFYSTPGAGRNEVRMAYVINQDDLKKALICLEKALVEYPGRILSSTGLTAKSAL
ncbi:pyridoxal phosphate-dependent aminotransferase [Solitalea lacus]|uniref:pyridoxal phosphate-dependent aminotransferase n=1 Tax=Solitalea lacus TaxID=2911172 RepID=UPI001ED9E40F|nr:pyridoxal phosphate-dependent aminotransferase [Solitalea lacus]UKJ06670.1 pyridoxal phosphate-dependent aminotransferase [Solitalea lacus]